MDPEDITSERILDIWRWVVEDEEAGDRVDRYLVSQDAGPSRSQIKRLIENGNALVDGERVRPAAKLRVGQLVELRVPPPEPMSALPEEMDLDIVHEDDDVVVVDKPQGLVVHPAPGHPGGTLVNGLLHACSPAGGDPLRPGIVHRLDKDTSGLMVVAKNDRAHASLAAQFHDHSVDRKYLVLVAGSPPARGEWRTLHGRRDGDRKRFSSKVRRGKTAWSVFERLERFEGAAMLGVELRTGRTHQVRVHCMDHGFPVLGDPWYGPRRLTPLLREASAVLPGQALHARVLGFDHPSTGERMKFESAVPRPFARALEMLGSRTEVFG